MHTNTGKTMNAASLMLTKETNSLLTSSNANPPEGVGL
jgi:hypothetical protein